MRRTFGFLIGIAVGGLVGSTIALLMAPESGEQSMKFVMPPMSVRLNCGRDLNTCVRRSEWKSKQQIRLFADQRLIELCCFVHVMLIFRASGNDILI
jgi:gas vesicle protein